MGEYDTNVGPILLGIILNTYLYGLVTNQYMNYVNHKFNDPSWIRTIVIILFVLDTTHSAVYIFSLPDFQLLEPFGRGIYAAWDLCVTNFNNPNILGTVEWTIPFTAIAVATSGVVTQVFLIHRVFKLTKNKWLLVFLATLSIGGYVCGWIAAVKSGIIKEVAKFRQIVPLVIGWLALLCIVDLLITAILIFVLVRSKTGFRRTDTIINRLIRGAIQTGLFASMFALGDLFFFRLCSTHDLLCNTLLDTLNARMVFYRMDQQNSSGGTGTGPFHMQTYIHPTCLDIPPDMLHNECAAGAPRTVESPRLDDKSNGPRRRSSPDEPSLLHDSSKV
ncbi:hypothetical protein B0H14DRAFT_2817701 [Mycena olivaceomarginata]|nr:hypothetical protein B0H14DRAFT_2817701 [Mycena olivaceomarginata]